MTTTITIINIKPGISAMLGGVTHAVLDVPESFRVRLSKSVEALSVLNKISTEAMLGVSVPFTPVNDALFSDYKNPVVLDSKRTYLNCQVIVDGIHLQFTRLYVKNKNYRSNEWELEINRDPNHWVELSAQTKLSDIDFGSDQLTEANVKAWWGTAKYTGDYTNPNSGNPVAWPIVDYGGWVDQTEPPQGSVYPAKGIGVEDLRPWFSLVYVLRAGFCKFGWSLESVLFDLDAIKSLWIYALTPDYYRAVDNDVAGRVVGQIYTRARLNSGDFLLLNYVNVQADYAVIDNSGVPTKRYAGIKNHSGIAIKYKFFFKGEFHNDRSLPFSAYFFIMEMIDDGTGYYSFSGEIISPDPLVIDFDPNEKKTVTFEQTVVLKPGQMAAIHIPEKPTTTPGFFVEKGFYFRCDHDNQSFVINNIVYPQRCASPEHSILDTLKGFVNLVNGKLETDFDTKTVTIFPNKTADVWGDTAPGFLLKENEVIDLSGKVIPNSIVSTDAKPELKRYTRFSFKESTDAYIASLSLDAPAHSRKLLNSLDYANEVEDVKNHIFEPTLEGQPKAIGSASGSRAPRPFMPRLWDNTGGQRSFAIGPRIAFAYANARQINPNPINAVNAFTSFFFNSVPNNAQDGLTEEFLYFTQANTWEITPMPPKYVDIVFGTKAKDLFTTFYLGYTQENRDGTLVDLLLNMTASDYASYNFRRLFRFKIDGVPIIAPMQSIRDFAGGATPVTFFVEPAALECCDLPCGCQFIECEYWQDFGVYMRAATLEDMSITSFEVDGIELVTSPIYFNDVHLIDIGGRPYVTNLVDALNTIGAPYFSFDYSTRVSASKGLRYFKVKKLLCTEFRIVVSFNGDEMYEYTHDSQKQKWFTGSWADMGYSGEVTGVPENCLITTEY